MAIVDGGNGMTTGRQWDGNGTVMAWQWQWHGNGMGVGVAQRGPGRVAIGIRVAIRRQKDGNWTAIGRGDGEWDWLYTSQATLEYDVVRQRPANNAFDAYQAVPLLWSSTSGNISSVSLSLSSSFFASNMEVGRWYVLRHQVYAHNAIGFQNLSSTVYRLISNLNLNQIRRQLSYDSSFAGI